MVIQVGSDPSIQPVPTLNAYLRRKFDNENIRVVTRPKKTDSLEVYIGEEFLGVLFLENRKGPQVVYFRVADFGRRSGRLGHLIVIPASSRESADCVMSGSASRE